MAQMTVTQAVSVSNCIPVCSSCDRTPDLDDRSCGCGELVLADTVNVALFKDAELVLLHNGMKAHASQLIESFWAKQPVSRRRQYAPTFTLQEAQYLNGLHKLAALAGCGIAKVIPQEHGFITHYIAVPNHDKQSACWSELNPED